MSDWEQFLHEVSWFLGPGERAAAGTSRPWTRGSTDALPQLSALLGSATVTPVTADGTDYELLAWGPLHRRRGWLCHPPSEEDGDAIHQTHTDFWSVCGGIIERFGEPNTWWTNQNDVLTAAATRVSVADILADYAWLWDDHAFEIPVNPDEYYTVAVEANGNLTLTHRDNGRLLLFAPDHAFTGVTPLPGWPPYSLLTIDDVPDLSTWIEVCASAWRHEQRHVT